MKRTLKKGITWIGYVDWGVRDFHGYSTDRGSTYNAYLIQDDKPTVIDTVKGRYTSDFLEKLSSYIDPEDVAYVVCNHAEPDHSGGLPGVMAACSNATLVCNARCQDILSEHYLTAEWKFEVIDEKSSLSIGRRTLTFPQTPMVHWPESMFTYVPEEKLLFSMDAFGQHLASANRFDDEEPLDATFTEAKAYYANIVMPYGKQVLKTLEKAAKLDIEMIAPSHGLIWRKNLEKILAAYRNWASGKVEPKILVIYDSMWGSTERMAHAILDGMLEHDVEAMLFDAKVTSNTVLATETLDAAALVVGSSTLNSTMLPTLASALTYLRGLKPNGKLGFNFGSYGWAPGGIKDVSEALQKMNIEIVREPIQVQYVPNEKDLDRCREAGKMLAENVLKQ